MKPHILALAALTLGTAACEDISSSDLLTSGMSAVINGTTEGDGATRVAVELRAGGRLSNTMVDLQGDDQLTASAGDESVVLSKQSLGNYHNYVGELPVDSAGTEFVVSLERTVDAGAPASTFTLPEPFAFGSTGSDLGPNQNLQFDWTPSGEGDEMEVVVDGDCIVLWSKELDGDPGAYEIPGDDIDVLGDEGGETCDVTVTLRRVRGGQLDSGYGEGGLVQGRQVRSFEATFRNE